MYAPRSGRGDSAGTEEGSAEENLPFSAFDVHMQHLLFQRQKLLREQEFSSFYGESPVPLSCDTQDISSERLFSYRELFTPEQPSIIHSTESTAHRRAAPQAFSAAVDTGDPLAEHHYSPRMPRDREASYSASPHWLMQQSPPRRQPYETAQRQETSPATSRPFVSDAWTRGVELNPSSTTDGTHNYSAVPVTPRTHERKEEALPEFIVEEVRDLRRAALTQECVAQTLRTDLLHKEQELLRLEVQHRSLELGHSRDWGYFVEYMTSVNVTQEASERRRLMAEESELRQCLATESKRGESQVMWWDNHRRSHREQTRALTSSSHPSERSSPTMRELIVSPRSRQASSRVNHSSNRRSSPQPRRSGALLRSSGSSATSPAGSEDATVPPSTSIQCKRNLLSEMAKEKQRLAEENTRLRTDLESLKRASDSRHANAEVRMSELNEELASERALTADMQEELDDLILSELCLHEGRRRDEIQLEAAEAVMTIATEAIGHLHCSQSHRAGRPESREVACQTPEHASGRTSVGTMTDTQFPLPTDVVAVTGPAPFNDSRGERNRRTDEANLRGSTPRHVDPMAEPPALQIQKEPDSLVRVRQQAVSVRASEALLSLIDGIIALSMESQNECAASSSAESLALALRQVLEEGRDAPTLTPSLSVSLGGSFPPLSPTCLKRSPVAAELARDGAAPAADGRKVVTCTRLFPCPLTSRQRGPSSPEVCAQRLENAASATKGHTPDGSGTSMPSACEHETARPRTARTASPGRRPQAPFELLHFFPSASASRCSSPDLDDATAQLSGAAAVVAEHSGTLSDCAESLGSATIRQNVKVPGEDLFQPQALSFPSLPSHVWDLIDSDDESVPTPPPASLRSASGVDVDDAAAASPLPNTHDVRGHRRDRTRAVTRNPYDEV